jgi:hypothetical protein
MINKLICFFRNLLWKKAEKSPALTWRTADGREIPITQMSYSHIRNAMRSLERRYFNETIVLEMNKTYTALKQERDRRKFSN